MASPWRLLLSPPASGAWNMALDEALLLTRQPEDAPTLRLYSWSQETISLGRFQRAAELEPARAAGDLAMVRRISSGGAIRHRPDEITYAIIAPYRLFGGRHPRLAYTRIHNIIAGALAALGIATEHRSDAPCDARAPFCYDRVTELDLLAGASKLVGSAQHRRGRAFLQHGSIPLSDDGSITHATSLTRLLGRAPNRPAVLAALRQAFEQSFGLEVGAIRDVEQARARQLHDERYASRDWTWER